MPGTILKQLSTTPQSNSTVITNANSGFTSIAIGTDNTATFQSAAAMSQAVGYRFSQGATGNQLTSYVDLDSPVAILALRIPLRMSAAPSTSMTFLRGYTNTAHTDISWSIQITNTMRINFGEQASGVTTTTGSATNERLVAGNDYVIQILINTTAQTFSLSTFARGSQTPINSINGTLASPMSAQRSIRFGINTNSSLVGNYIDTNSAFAIGSDDFLVRHDVSNASPTVTLSSNLTSLNAGDTAAITATASDSDGTITNLEWSTSYGTLTGSGSTRTITAPTVPNNISVTVTVVATDNGGATATDSITLTFLAGLPGNILRQLSSTPQTNNTVVNAANSNLSSITIGTGNSATFQSAAAMGQPVGYRFAQGADGNQLTSYIDLAEPVDVISLRVPIRISKAPTSSLTILRGYSDAGHANTQWSIQLTSTLRVNFGQPLGVTTSTGNGPLERLVAGTEYVMQILIDTANSTFSLTTYPLNSQIPLNSMSGDIEPEMAPIQSIRFGLNTNSVLADGYVDTNSAFAIGSGELLQRHDVDNYDPTLSVTTTKNVLFPGEFTTMTASAADSDGTIASVAWSTTYGTLVGTGNIRTITAPPLLNDLTVTVQITATDNLGGIATRFIVLTFKGSMHKVYTSGGWAPAVARIED